HLHAAINQRCSIIGVAKNRYQNSRHADEVLRGGSARPLFVTAIGMPQTNASAKIAAMAGEFRIPTLIRLADQLARRQIIAELDKTAGPIGEIGDEK
ncbi:MAG: hypothetical protein K8T25_05075, partial [Planctomycetia bacterium]|nr:hypothetical protein [Planctomycetia bacterium]